MGRNIERLLKVADVIEEHPDQFDMCSWWNDHTDAVARGFEYEPELLGRMVARADLCGTTACIAGWACFLWPAEVDAGRGFSDNGAKILGLDGEPCGCHMDCEKSSGAAILFGSTGLGVAGAATALRALAGGATMGQAIDDGTAADRAAR